jgi:tetratricopeptide (TPR) repeat protein
MVIFANPDFNLQSTKAGGTEPKSRATTVAWRQLQKKDLEGVRLPLLPGTEKESSALQTLAKAFGWPTEAFQGRDATKARLRRLQSPRILHLATHGFFLPEGDMTLAGAAAGARGVGGLRPISDSAATATAPPKQIQLSNPMQRSGLMLAGAEQTLRAWAAGRVPPTQNDGIVTAEEVASLNLSGTWLAVLSACETGVGEAAAGEGVMGLRRGFIQAGAQNLLMTLWSVEDEETAKFIVDFYSQAQKTGNAPQALAQTQRDWLVKLRKERGVHAAVTIAGPFIMSFQGGPQDKSNAGRQRDLSLDYERVGDLLVAQGKLRQALDVYQQALAIAKRLADQDKSNTDWQRDLSVSYEKIGGVLVAQGKLRDALEDNQQSLNIRRVLAEQDKSNTGWQRDLSISYNKLGDVLEARGKLPEALDLYQQALAIAKRLADQDKSNTGWQRDLSISYENVGGVLEAQGKFPEALEVYQQELAISKRLAEQDKFNAGRQRDLSMSYGKVGDVLVAQGKLQDALDGYQQGLTTGQRLAEQDKSNADSQRDLSWIYEKVGGVLEAQSKLPDALDAYQQSLNIRRTLADQDKSNADSQRDLSWIYEKVGEVLQAQGKLPDAVNAYQQSLNIRRTLADQDKSNAEWQRDLGVSYVKVGEILRSQGKVEEALKAFQRALDIAQKLAQQDPTNGDWQHDLGVSWERIGYVRQDQNDLTGAAEAYVYELQVCGKLSGIKPDDAGLETDYAESKLDVAGVYRLLGRQESALQLLKEAKNILVDLQKRAPLSPSQQQILDRIEKELSTLKQSAKFHKTTQVEGLFCYKTFLVQRDTGMLEEALKAYRQALAIAAKLAQLDT